MVALVPPLLILALVAYSKLNGATLDARAGTMVGAVYAFMILASPVGLVVLLVGFLVSWSVRLGGLADSRRGPEKRN